jgi:hypothetical protein
MLRIKIAPTHSVRFNDDEKPYCLLCGGENKELIEECTDQDPLDVRRFQDQFEYDDEDYTK